jgi:hypothetical protein
MANNKHRNVDLAQYCKLVRLFEQAGLTFKKGTTVEISC